MYAIHSTNMGKLRIENLVQTALRFSPPRHSAPWSGLLLVAQGP
jgi:hypothetical protein